MKNAIDRLPGDASVKINAENIALLTQREVGARYEKLRRMTPREFTELWKHSTSPTFKGNFDALVDVWHP